ncbi:MAG TPA: taurine catabolism dioxygenase TauD [Aliiroseovarius sp.]|nr:taurine catabolism dioxygenase TauD [Aliiroseovarius sp.]
MCLNTPKTHTCPPCDERIAFNLYIKINECKQKVCFLRKKTNSRNNAASANSTKIGVGPINTPEKNSFLWNRPNTYDFYQDWRAARIAASESAKTAGFIQVSDLANPTESEKLAIIGRCRDANLALYEAPAADNLRKSLRQFAERFDLRIAERHRSAGEQGIVALTESNAPGQKGYIPYSKRKMNWHTDGYYNAPSDRISAMVLHCAQPAESGGSNQFLDSTIAFIRLWDENPDYARALMHPEAMVIPENVEADGSVRPASVGPVFYGDPDTGRMQMRYTARTRSIAWRDDPLTREAVAFLQSTLEGPDPLTISLKFKAGQGVLCNNVLHDRTGFDPKSVDKSPRVMYRVRFTNRVKGT